MGPQFQRPEQVHLREKKGRAMKDVFELQVGIEGAEEASAEDKYIFVEDQHALGDVDMLGNEAEKGENTSNLLTYGALFLIIAVAAGICCYFNYTFPATLAKAVFWMFLGSFLGDIVVTRPLLLMLLACLKFSRARKQGYDQVEYQDYEEIKDKLRTAIKDMFK